MLMRKLDELHIVLDKNDGVEIPLLHPTCLIMWLGIFSCSQHYKLCKKSAWTVPNGKEYVDYYNVIAKFL